MTRTYRIKELSDLTSVTIRALHHYDAIHLLKPSHKSTSGHRLYSETDLFRLQQIVTLKFMGFSLSQIRHIISKPGFNIKESLRTQCKEITDQATRLESIAKLLQSIVNQLNSNDTVNWEKLAKIIEVMQMSESNKAQWHEKYLTTDELDEFEKLTKKFPEEYWKKYHERWVKLFEEVEENLELDPESKTGMALAKKWLDLVDEVYPRSSSLRKKLWEAYQAGIIPQNTLPHNPNVISYITKATAKLKEAKLYP